MSDGKAVVVIMSFVLLLSFAVDFIVYLQWKPILNHTVGKMLDIIFNMSLFNLGLLCLESTAALVFTYLAFISWLSAIMIWRVKKDFE